LVGRSIGVQGKERRESEVGEEREAMTRRGGEEVEEQALLQVAAKWKSGLSTDARETMHHRREPQKECGGRSTAKALRRGKSGDGEKRW